MNETEYDSKALQGPLSSSGQHPACEAPSQAQEPLEHALTPLPASGAEGLDGEGARCNPQSRSACLRPPTQYDSVLKAARPWSVAAECADLHIVPIIDDGEVRLEIMPTFRWFIVQELPAIDYVCGYCGVSVGSNMGIGGTESRIPGINSSMSAYTSQGSTLPRRVYMCPRCERFSYWESGNIVSPLPKPGQKISGLPVDIGKVYEEIRSAIQAGAYTSSVLMGRTLLSHIAEQEGAPKKRPFNENIEWLDANHFIPPKGKGWVNIIREKANEAAHELEIFDAKQANGIFVFVAHLLRNVYEMPGMIPGP